MYILFIHILECMEDRIMCAIKPAGLYQAAKRRGGIARSTNNQAQ